LKVLLDAHTLIWAVDDPSKLGRQAVTALQYPANDLLISAGTIWEIAIKVGLGKLSLSMPYRQWMLQTMADLRRERAADHGGVRRCTGESAQASW
jgi:PIN domain nuclease of toxin-antitoxin system